MKFIDIDNPDILGRLKDLSEYLIMKGGKKNTSKLIKVKRPFRTKSGKVAYRDTWILPGQVKSDEKIHNEHKLHHKLPKEHPDYKKKELHPNFVAGRDKHLEARKKPKAEAPKKPKGNKEPSEAQLAKHQSIMRDAALRVMEQQNKEDQKHKTNFHNIASTIASYHEPSMTYDHIKKKLQVIDPSRKVSHKDIHDAIQWSNNLPYRHPHERITLKMRGKDKKKWEAEMHPAIKKRVADYYKSRYGGE